MSTMLTPLAHLADSFLAVGHSPLESQRRLPQATTTVPLPSEKMSLPSELEGLNQRETTMRGILGAIVAALFLPMGTIGKEPAPVPEETACLLVEPVICRSSEGTDPAVSRIDRKAIESVYAKASIQIAWLPARYLDHTGARDGELDWREIAELGKKQGLWESGPTRVSLVLVNKIHRMPIGGGLGAIDSRPERPLGAGGPICLVSLPKEPRNPAMESYCIAHEMGHCLGLKHADKDPLHPQDTPSIMNGGGGKFSYSDRIGKTALVPSQIDLVRKSPLLWWPRQGG